MNKKPFVPWLASICGLLFLVAGCATGPRGFPPVNGIANFEKVNHRLYRGAQPDKIGLQNLQKLGIGTIVNLRMTNDAWALEKDEVTSLGMTYVNLPMSGIRRPSKETVSAVLAIIEQSPSPVFVHCKHGCDRTGTIIACYRIKQEGWTSQEALNEARTYDMGWWQIWMKSFVKDFEHDTK